MAQQETTMRERTTSTVPIPCDILLLSPPFGTAEHPSISIPVLAAYLRRQQVTVQAFDIQREFYARLLRPSNILQGLRRAEERFFELNARPTLSYAELFEYRIAVQVLVGIQPFRKEMQFLFSPFASFQDLQRSKATNLFIRAATFPYFPNMIFSGFPVIPGSMYSEYSTTDILQASEQTDYLTTLFEAIIAEQILPRYQPRIIGISVAYPAQILSAFQCARLLKHHLPGAHITMGGPIISFSFRKIQNPKLFDIIDSLVVDEGEIPLETLSRELKASQPDLTRVPGLIYRKDRRIHANAPVPPVDLALAPPPDYTVFDLDGYLTPREELMLPVQLSKGCRWQRCAFCGTNLSFCRNYQQLPPDIAYTRLRQVLDSTGVSSVMFTDEALDPVVLEEVATRLIHDRVNIRWTGHTRVSRQLTVKRTQRYIEAGCLGLSLGVESFSDRILKLMRKGTTVAGITWVLTNLAGQIPLNAYMIVGFPTETVEEAQQGYRQLHALISKNVLRSCFYSPFGLVVGSDVWSHPEKYAVADIVGNPGNDLLHEVYQFAGPGMTRDTMMQLYRQFMHVIPDRWIRKLVVQKTPTPVKYDGRQVQLEHHIDDLPFTKWIMQQEQKFLPICQA